MLRKILFSISVLTLSILLKSCSKENTNEILLHDIKNNISDEKEDVIEEEIIHNILKTVPLEYSKKFFENLKTTSSSNKGGIELDVDVNSIRQEEIEGTNQKITVVDASTKFEYIKSVILQIEIDGKIETIVSNLIPDNVSEKKEINKINNRSGATTSSFRGRVVTANIRGVVLNDHRVYRGRISSSNYVRGRNTDPAPILLDEVVVTAPEIDNSCHVCPSPSQLASLDIEWMMHPQNLSLMYGLRDRLLEKMEQDYRKDMSSQERRLYDTMSKKEKFDYLRSGKEAIDETNELYKTPCERHNGKGDAFRYAYWNALSTSRIGIAITELLTTAHENKPSDYPYHRKENTMDLYNNKVGRNIGLSNTKDLKKAVLDALKNGRLKYLNNLSTSNCRATYNSNIIFTNK